MYTKDNDNDNEKRIEHVISFQPLKFGNLNSNIKNILLIDTDVYQNEIFFNSVNEHTLPIFYTTDSDLEELKNYLSTNFTAIDRIGFVFNDAMMDSKQFVNSKLFFTSDDLIDGQTTFSSNLNGIINLIKQFKIINIDFLVCNGLKYPNWVKYFELLNKETGVIVGASDDETGNIKYGGDWVLESTGQDVSNIYWNLGISNYTTTLATSTISTSTTVTNADLNDPIIYTWPIIINGGTSSSPVVITFGFDITLNSTSKYFIIGSEYITIDGGNNNVIINNVTNYPGLVRNGTSSVNGKSNITIQNINMSILGGSTIAENTGWMCHNWFGKGVVSNKIKNCSSSCAISNNFAGGIAGSNIGSNSGSVAFVDCYSTGVISGKYSGGIAGSSAGVSGSVVFTNCYSSGVISGNEAGGIAGSSAGVFSGSAKFTNCYSTGAISGNEAGGVAGPYAGVAGLVIFTNCYSSGVISGTSAGGIHGPNSGTITLTNTYIANGSWSDSNAIANLIGTPTYTSGLLVNPIGDVWADVNTTSNNVPWLFATFGYSPYTTELTQTFVQTVEAGNKSSPALDASSGHVYTIIAVNDKIPSVYPSITINSVSGEISVGSSTPAGRYSIKILQQSNYTLTNFELTVQNKPKYKHM